MAGEYVREEILLAVKALFEEDGGMGFILLLGPIVCAIGFFTKFAEYRKTKRENQDFPDRPQKDLTGARSAMIIFGTVGLSFLAILIGVSVFFGIAMAHM